MQFSHGAPMDPLTTFPIEIRQVILEELPSLKSLQCAILGSRALLVAYQSSRKHIRQVVFRNEYRVLESDAKTGDATNAYKQTALTRARYRVGRLAETSSGDWLILHQALWPLLLADVRIPQDPLNAACFFQWSVDLVETSLSEGLEQDAGEIETQTLRVIFRSGGLAKLGLDWLRGMTAVCKRQERFSQGQQLLLQAWDDVSRYLNGVSSRQQGHRVGIAVVDCTAIVCRGGEEGTQRRIILAKAWDFLQRASTDWDLGVVCHLCLNAADRLASVSTGTSEISGLETTWRKIPPRSPPFATWSRIFVDCHSVGLEGILKIWNRLREVPDPFQFAAYDLNWAREIIMELRKQEQGQDQSLAFQAWVLQLLNPAQPQYYAFGRNLADSYLKNGHLEEAIRVREDMMRNTLPSASVFRSSALALIALYLKIGRDDAASDLKRKIK